MDKRLKNFTDDDLREELRQRKIERHLQNKKEHEKWIYWHGEVSEIIYPQVHDLYSVGYKIKKPSTIIKDDEDLALIENATFYLMRGKGFRRRTMPKVGDIVKLRYRNNPSSKSGQIQNSKIVEIMQYL